MKRSDCTVVRHVALRALRCNRKSVLPATRHAKFCTRCGRMAEPNLAGQASGVRAGELKPRELAATRLLLRSLPKQVRASCLLHSQGCCASGCVLCLTVLPDWLAMQPEVAPRRWNLAACVCGMEWECSLHAMPA